MQGLVPHHLYKRRWYILILFSLLSSNQTLFGNTFGPIAKVAEPYFNVTSGTIEFWLSWVSLH